MKDKRAVLFCSSSAEIDPDFNQAARKIVRAACLAGYSIVSGGTIKGMMNVIGDEVAALGGDHTGVLPRYFDSLVHPRLSRVIWTETMSERKSLMLQGSSVAIALPGGVGTLDEISEAFCLRKLGRYSGKIIVCNVKGFYDPLLQLFDHYVATGMLDAGSRALIEFPSTFEEFEKLI